MKFSDRDSYLSFLTEVNMIESLPSKDDELIPSEEMMEIFISRRSKMEPIIKDFRKSQFMKAQWRSGRYEMLKAIRGFHKSTKGKQFHRSMSRFLTSKIFREPVRDKKESLNGGLISNFKALSSLKTNMLIFLEYYRPLHEDILFKIFFERCNSAIYQAERLVSKNENINSDIIDILLYSVNEKNLIGSISDELNKDFNSVWDSYCKKLEDESKSLYEIISSL